MTIKIEMLRCFCTVARTGNLSEAADRLGRTQSAVSMTLKQLENHLGRPLFETERKNRLTRLGQQVFDLGAKQLRQYDTTIRTIEDSARFPQGLLRIASVPSVAALVYPAVAAQLSHRHPGLHIEMRDSDTQQVIDALTQGWADIGIASGKFPLNGVTCTPLFEDPFGLVCARDHPLVSGPESPGIAEVLSVPFLGNALCDMIETEEFRTRLGAAHVMIHNTHSLLAMVRTGDWVTVLPRSVSGVLPEGVGFHPVQGLPDVRKVHLYLHEYAHSPEVARDAHGLIASLDWLAP